MATEAPDISVVMGVYNGERYLRASLMSVLDQRDVNFECIVVDDGSTDGTPAILAEIAVGDSRLRVLTQENAGLTRALIRGCAEARGRYIARHDCDDVSLQGRLRQQQAMLDSDPTLAFVSCWTEVIGPGGERLLTYERPIDSAEATRMLCEERVGTEHGSVMFRRDAYERVGGYRRIFYYAQDNDLWLRLVTVGRLGYVPSLLYQYRISAESISGHLHADKLPYAELIEELREARRRGMDEEPILARAVLPKPGGNRRTRSSADTTLYFVGRCLFARHDPRARVYLRQSLRRNPLRLRTWLLWSLTELAAPFWAMPAADL